MKVIVVHEDGDRTTRVEGLASELRTFIAEGSSYAFICDGVEVQTEWALR